MSRKYTHHHDGHGEHSHGNGHQQAHRGDAPAEGSGHSHTHGHAHLAGTAHGAAEAEPAVAGNVLTVRAHSGLSGDIMLTGMARMLGADRAMLDALLETLNIPGLSGSVRLEERRVNGISGWGCAMSLPHEHAHRSLTDIQAIIQASSLPADATVIALKTFSLLAKAEGAVHGKAPESVTFHEVGALDSIVDICLVSALFMRLAPARFVCSPLPLADGGVLCAHGWIPVPAPAVLRLLEGVPVCSFAGEGETVTPTAIALLKALGAEFAPWPAMRIERQDIVYGTRVFENAPNGSIWALGPGVFGG